MLMLLDAVSHAVRADAAALTEKASCGALVAPSAALGGASGFRGVGVQIRAMAGHGGRRKFVL